VSVIVAPTAVLHSENAHKQITYAELRSALRLYDLTPDDRWSEALVVEAGANLRIDSSEDCPMLRRVLNTQSLEQYKEWIGVPDSQIQSGLVMPPRELPSAAAERLEQPKNLLDAADLEDLKRAFDYYVFGNSAVVSDYRTAIALHHAPFAAALYACSQLEVQSDASLEFTNLPVILLVDRLMIHQGGSLKFYTPAKIVVNVLEKFGA
jgi:hypothetical protein